MLKTLDQKLAALRANPGANAFILADAKDADMAFGIGSAGQSPEAHPGETRFRTIPEYRAQIREIVTQGLVDIMLMSASTSDALTIQERLFDHSAITPAARANDTSDIFVVRGGKYIQDPSRPHRTASIDHIQCGHVDCRPEERSLGANLGLYSVTFTGTTDNDLRTLQAFHEFRMEAERKGFRYFLEVFDPNVPTGHDAPALARFVNDMIVRSLAGVTAAGRPDFLKVVYHGPKAMEELVAYDPSIIVGIMGGGAGTTYDAFKLLAEARKYGARAALFGRKINQAEHQLAFIHFLRLLADGQIEPEEAVHAYHAVLARLGVRPRRPLAEDLQLRTNVMSYGGQAVAVSLPEALKLAAAPQPAAAPASPSQPAEPSASEPLMKPSGCKCHDHDHGAKSKPKSLVTSAADRPVTLFGQKPDACPCGGADSDRSPVTNGKPDFAKMTSSQRLDYHRRRIAALLGER